MLVEAEPKPRRRRNESAWGAPVAHFEAWVGPFHRHEYVPVGPSLHKSLTSCYHVVRNVGLADEGTNHHTSLLVAVDVRSVRRALAVTNTGDKAGAEIVRLSVKDLEASVDRPAKELKAFTKIRLLPGQTKRAELALARDAFEFFRPARRNWVVEPGAFELLIGSSSRDIRLSDRIVVK